VVNQRGPRPAPSFEREEAPYVKIVVCIKRVPDTEARIRVLGAGANIDVAGLKYVISPYDEFALEGALRVKEAGSDVEVVAVSLGDHAAAEQLRTALAMGADRAVLVRGESPPDGLAVAKTLAAAVREESPDLLLFGIKSADQDQQQVGPMVAELLEMPCVSAVSSFQLADGSVRADRELDGAVASYEASLPCVLTITKGEYEPRYPTLRGIMAAKRKPLEEVEAVGVEARVRVLSLEPPPERPPATILDGGVDEVVSDLVQRLRREAGVL